MPSPKLRRSRAKDCKPRPKRSSLRRPGDEAADAGDGLVTKLVLAAIFRSKKCWIPKVQKTWVNKFTLRNELLLS